MARAGRQRFKTVNLRERLQAWRETLPENGSVVLTRAALDEMLADEWSGDTEDDRGPDYTVAEIAERFGRSPQTVRDWIKSGKLKGYLFNGREYRVTRAALAEFEASQRDGADASVRSARNADLGAWRRVSGL
jgi:excisionase family DNA binding protein